MKIILNNNREINLHQLFQFKTYTSLYAGFPTKEINDFMLGQTTSYVRDKIWCPTTPYIIQPKITQHIHNGKEYEFMPDYTCIAHFESCKPTKNNNGEILSSLTIIWLQDNWALPIDPEIMTQIQQIDWDNLAHNFDL